MFDAWRRYERGILLHKQMGGCDMDKKNEVVLFETEDKSIVLPVMVENEMVWLSQAQMIELFDRDQSVVSRHINNVFREEEVDKESNMHFLHITTADRPVAVYSLDVVISVGYRVKSKRGVEFRKWANSVLRQYIIKGYAVNTNRINQLGEVIRIMKRTENSLDSKQVLSVIEKYNTALDLLGRRFMRVWKRKQQIYCTLSRRIIAFGMETRELLQLCSCTFWIRMVFCL